MKRNSIGLLLIILCMLPLTALLIPSGWLPHFQMSANVEKVFNWLPNAFVGVVFTTLGLLKVYGWRKGIVGGGGKPASCRLLGRCPSWSKQFNFIFTTFLLGIGVVNLGVCLGILLGR